MSNNKGCAYRRIHWDICSGTSQLLWPDMRLRSCSGSANMDCCHTRPHLSRTERSLCSPEGYRDRCWRPACARIPPGLRWRTSFPLHCKNTQICLSVLFTKRSMPLTLSSLARFLVTGRPARPDQQTSFECFTVRCLFQWCFKNVKTFFLIEIINSFLDWAQLDKH